MVSFYSKLILGLFIILTTIKCSDEQTSEREIYEYLEICFEDYYLNYNVEVTKELTEFEKHLLKEGHLTDTTGKAYKILLEKLSKDIYFSPPLRYDAFDNSVLYKVPGDIKECASSIFGIDTNLVKKTEYFKAQEKIRLDLKINEEVSIGNVFKYNNEHISTDLIKAPFVKQSIQQLLYRWYFKSKYDREIPIEDLNDNAKEDSLSSE